MRQQPRGTLILIGGAENKTPESVILQQAPRLMGRRQSLVILTTATEQPGPVGESYRKAFQNLGVRKIQVLNISTRAQANHPTYGKAIASAGCVFLTGGDQLRITSILGGTLASRALLQLYRQGGVIMGTSAGASVMSSTMIVEGEDNEPAKKCTLKMAPGLGLLEGVIIDQHFDQRGRFGRLLCGIAESPGTLGIGIDEDTAVKVRPDLRFEVLGANAVTVLDGRSMISSNVSELRQNEILAVAGVQVHVLPQGYGYDLKSRKVLRLNHETKRNQNL